MMMKRKILTFSAAAATLALCAFSFSGCRQMQFEKSESVSRVENPASMTYAQALEIIEERMSNIPEGHQPKIPDVKDRRSMKRFSTGITSVRLSKNRITGHCLVELMNHSKVLESFYVLNAKEGKEFSAAVDRIRQEYK